MKAQGLPILPHQKDALEKAGKALEAIRPHAVTDLDKALERRPELIAEAVGGRSQEAMRAMQHEAAVRTDPALRTERFVSDWQGLSTARNQLEQQGDRAGAARVSAKLTELAKGLNAIRRLKACCAARRANSASIQSPNAASPMNSPQPSPASAPAPSTWAFRRTDMEDDHIEEVQLDLEVEEPPALVPKPEVVTEADPATEAFARLEGEMAMVRHTVQNMARERADIVIPDYTATLGQMADQLERVSRTLAAIGDKPAIELTPEDIAVQIKRASLNMLHDASDLLLCRRRVGRRHPAMVDPARHHRSRHARKLALARKFGSQGRGRTDDP
ncbi:hypothetical protein [Erythrobacter aureus]|uniref:hypothetical protein n=1 Tax=Erythrobacter aureus TaxID=2182384 RepID=UPI0018F86675|nr:hypothetical protein [Erythrobacter aureus]